jgi:diamine N-acetyltransferase
VVAELINELAQYEKLSAESRPDAAVLARDMAGLGGPVVEVLLATDTDTSEAIGFALFFQNYSTFLTQWGLHMEDLYVKPHYRGKGVGRALVQTVARSAVSRNCERFEWSVLNWNDLAINFYKSIGAVPMREWTTWRLSGDRLKEAAGM